MSNPRTTATVDRVQTLAVIVAASTGRTYRLYGLRSLETRKDDSGNVGGWSFDVPSTRAEALYGDRAELYGQSRGDDALEYLQAAGPMDLVALFARRLSTSGTGRARPTVPIGPDPSVPLVYGGDGGATVAALAGAADIAGAGGEIGSVRPVSFTSCLMVGMVDRAFETMDAGGLSAGVRVEGRDLTKIPYVNDSQVPVADIERMVVPPLLLVALARSTSGPALLLELMDLLIGKTLSDDARKAIGLTPAGVAVFNKEYGAYGYPWRDFISTARVDRAPGFEAFTQGTFAQYQVQQGSAWAGIMELANPPNNRLFIDEFGQLVFDDAFAAWTTASATEVPEADIVTFRAGFSDDELITFLSVWPAGSLAARENISSALAVFRANRFVSGLAEAAKASEAKVNVYGYRNAVFTSLYDNSVAAVIKRRKAVTFMHNNLWTAELTVNGTGSYRVGDRYKMPDSFTMTRPEVTGRTWYCRGVRHLVAQDDSFATELDLAYPDPIVGSNVP